MSRIKIALFFLYLMLNDWRTYSSPDQSISYLFSHGIADTHKQAYWYTKSNPEGIINSRYLIPGRLFTFDFNDATDNFWCMDFTQTSLAQGNEILRLKKAFDDTMKILHNEHTQNIGIVLIGLSRGAATTLSFMGMFNPKEVRALVLESPFDSTQGLVTTILSNAYLDWVPGLKNFTHSLMEWAFMQHNKDGISPIQAAQMIRKDLPILLISSKQDSLVPAPSTLNLYKTLRSCGNKHAYIFQADTGFHAKILPDKQGDQYQKVVHAFYKKYNLPCDQTLASQGNQLLLLCQPAL